MVELSSRRRIDFEPGFEPKPKREHEHDGADERLRLVTARGTLARLRGLLGRRRPPARAGLWLAPCRLIHTVGMRHDIAVAFIDREGRVCRWIERLAPWRCAGSMRAVAVVELPVGVIEATARGFARIEAEVARETVSDYSKYKKKRARKMRYFLRRIIK